MVIFVFLWPLKLSIYGYPPNGIAFPLVSCFISFQQTRQMNANLGQVMSIDHQGNMEDSMNGGTPRAGWFHGKCYLEMDDSWGLAQ